MYSLGENCQKSKREINIKLKILANSWDRERMHCCGHRGLKVLLWLWDVCSTVAIWVELSSVQSLSRIWLFVTPNSTPGFPVHHQLPELAQTHVHWVGDAIQISHSLLLLLPSIFPSIRLFSNESVLRIRWPKYRNFTFSINPSNEYSGMISFRIDWFELLAVQGALKSLLQHHSSKAAILQRSAFFIVQFSQLYMTTGKMIALTRWTFVGKVMSLLFNMLSGFVLAFLPRSKHLLISWLQSPSAVILEPKKIKTITVSIVSPSVCHEVRGPDAMIFIFWMLRFKPASSLSSFTFIKRLFTSSLSAIRVVSSGYLRLFIFLLAILILVCASSSLAFHIMYSA